MKRILVCEDEQDAQESLKNILEKADYEVFSAVDGKESVELAKKLRPDLVLLDIRMPKIDGLEVAKQIRKFDAETKIIFLTAFQGQELSKEASKYDIFDYIVKPVSHQDILNNIEKAFKE